MPCAEALRVQAYFDCEVDAVTALSIESHIEHCQECRVLLQDLQQLRFALRDESMQAGAPAHALAKVIAALDKEDASSSGSVGPQSTPTRVPSRPRAQLFWRGALSGAATAAVAAACAFLLFIPSRSDLLLNDLADAHLRSLLPAHLIDVESSDRHTVKPWFAGHTDVSPIVIDLESRGYRLIGGRADYLNNQRAAVVVYRRGAHTINVFSWAAGRLGVPADTTFKGYHFAFWRAGDLTYCAVSDAGWDELRGLAQLLRDADATANQR
jgi:anti-sigma factor RsiW